MREKFNLSAWALEHTQMVAYLILVVMLAGAISYSKLGRSEDPPFTFKVMVVRTLWPGAPVPQVEKELTERIEKKLQDTPWVDSVRSVTRTGESLVFITLKDYTPPVEVPGAWYQVRKELNDIKDTLPNGVLGPYPNDEFGDVDILLYALSGEGFPLGELRQHADRIARELRMVPDVRKIELIGVQDEKIFIDLAPSRAAALGITVKQITDALKAQNVVSPAGFIETETDRVRLTVSGSYDTVESVRHATVNVGGRSFQLNDVARIYRGTVEPPAPTMRVRGEPAIGFGIVAAKGGNVIALGEHVKAKMKALQETLPAGIDLHVVADQPEVVKSSVELFVESLGEALAIVLAVSFISLGLRTGTVVALSIPLVLALTFVLMKIFGIDLQRISLGALVIALGLLVDDAIIAVEMMVVKMEQGWDRFRAATYAYSSTAFPMLTGTLVTAAGFLPVGFAKSAAGEYTFSIFAVVCIALLASWLVAVFFTPYIGSHLLNPDQLKAKAQQHGDDIYDTPFYRRFQRMVEWCLDHRWQVIGATAGTFVISMVLFGVVIQKQFFPSSSRPDLLVDVWLPQGASLKATEAEVKKIESLLRNEAELSAEVEDFVAYVGNGAPRYFLSLDQQLFNDNYAQLVILSKGLESREVLKAKLDKRFAEDPAFAHIRLRTGRLENGPPVGYPVQFRVAGEDAEKVRAIASQVAEVMRADPGLRDVNFDWFEKAKGLRVQVDQGRAAALGVTSQDVSQALYAWLNGTTLTQYREGDQLIDVVLRGRPEERNSLSRLPDLDVVNASGRHVPIAQVATLEPVLEDGVIWRRDRQPTITVRADLVSEALQGPTLSLAINPKLDVLRATLPAGYSIVMGGAIEESAKGEESVMAVMPIMLLVVLTLLMVQLQSISRMIMVVLTAPLGMIGVFLGLLIFHAPFGFVANLGVIALSGMIMRNSVILMDQIEQDEKGGKTKWDAVVGSTVRRFRPIVLTAAAAIMAMFPLTRQVFWGPMAIAIMGGLIVATALTCLFLPALFAAWFKVRRDS